MTSSEEEKKVKQEYDLKHLVRTLGFESLAVIT